MLLPPPRSTLFPYTTLFRSLCARVVPRDLSLFLVDFYREKGVKVEIGQAVKQIVKREDRFTMHLANGKDMTADSVVAGLGIQPNVDLAKQAGLPAENGILVDEKLRTSDPDIYAAGDVANFPNPALGKRIRVEHEDNANSMGKVAGLNMAGADQRYDHLPFFYSDMFDLGYE